MFMHADLENLKDLKRYFHLLKEFKEKKHVVSENLGLPVGLLYASCLYYSIKVLDLGYLLSIISSFILGCIIFILPWFLFSLIEDNKYVSKLISIYDSFFKSAELKNLEKTYNKIVNDIKKEINKIFEGQPYNGRIVRQSDIEEIYSYLEKFHFVYPNDKRIKMFLSLFRSHRRYEKSTKRKDRKVKTKSKLNFQNGPAWAYTSPTNKKKTMINDDRLNKSKEIEWEDHSYKIETKTTSRTSIQKEEKPDNSHIAARRNKEVSMPTENNIIVVEGNSNSQSIEVLDLDKSLQSRLKEINISYKFREDKSEKKKRKSY